MQCKASESKTNLKEWKAGRQKEAEQLRRARKLKQQEKKQQQQEGLERRARALVSTRQSSSRKPTSWRSLRSEPTHEGRRLRRRAAEPMASRTGVRRRDQRGCKLSIRISWPFRLRVHVESGAAARCGRAVRLLPFTAARLARHRTARVLFSIIFACTVN